MKETAQHDRVTSGIAWLLQPGSRRLVWLSLSMLIITGILEAFLLVQVFTALDDGIQAKKEVVLLQKKIFAIEQEILDFRASLLRMEKRQVDMIELLHELRTVLNNCEGNPDEIFK